MKWDLRRSPDRWHSGGSGTVEESAGNFFLYKFTSIAESL